MCASLERKRFVAISGVSHSSVQAAAAAVDQESRGATRRSSICRRDLSGPIFLTLEEVVETVPRRLASVLQRPVPPRSPYADSEMLRGLSGGAFEKIASLDRNGVAREAARLSPENLLISIHDPRAMRGRTGTPRRELASQKPKPMTADRLPVLNSYRLLQMTISVLQSAKAPAGDLAENEIERGLRLSRRSRLQFSGNPCGRLGVFSERRERHAERALEGAIRNFHELTDQSRGAHGVTRSRRSFAFSDLKPCCRQQDQGLEEHAQPAVSMRNLPKTFPSLMSFPVITVIEEVQAEQECV
jgi:hypothetical protein